MVHVAYFTDPLCPWSWVAEPKLRDILEEFSGQARFTYVMAGMARDIHAEQKLASTLEATAETGVPADPGMWTRCPPESSYPACAAVKAAGLQGLDAEYLRRLREGAFLRGECLDDDDAFLVAAADVEGLDVERFAAALRSGEAEALFRADRENAMAACGDDRPKLPAFSVDGGQPVGIDELRDAILTASRGQAP